jgi:hypothetical protein
MSLRNRLRLVSIGTVATLFAATFVAHPASAADGDYAMAGTASATYVNVLGGVVESGPTSTSQLQTISVSRSNSNQLASVDLAGLLHAEALSTDVATSSVLGGQQITSTARAAGVSLLNGLIKLNAVTTSSTAKVVNGLASYSGGTELVGLVVNNRKIPINVAKNTTINVPGVVKVVVNQTSGENTSDAGAKVNSAGLEVTLLKPVKNYKQGTVVVVTPTAAAIAPDVQTEGPPIGGYGHVVKASITAGNSVKVLAGPVAIQYVGGGGTGGRTDEQATLRVNLAPIAVANVAGTAVTASRTVTHGAVEITSRATNLRLLGGVITVDAVTSTSSVSRDSGAPEPTRTGSSSIVGLKISGKAIKVDAAPNTKINILGIGTLTLNQQVQTADGLLVRALDLTLGTASKGVPAGAEIEVATALAAVGK